MTNVLVVDSERSIRNTLKERLEYEGFRVETAETGSEAADKTEKSTYDIVLCDINAVVAKRDGTRRQFDASRSIRLHTQTDQSE